MHLKTPQTPARCIRRRSGPFRGLALATLLAASTAPAGADPAAIELSDLDSTTGLVVSGFADFDLLGSSVAPAGDVNGDGFDDYLIGAPGAHQSGAWTGEVYVVFGNEDLIVEDLEPTDLDGDNGFTIYGIDDEDYAGVSVAGAGDVNGDGLDDIVIGAEYAADNAGEAYVVFGDDEFSASLSLADLDGTDGFLIQAESAGDRAGASVSGAGDFDGDGFDDLLIGAYIADAGHFEMAGKAYVIFGDQSPFAATLMLSDLDGTDGFVIRGGHDEAFTGYDTAAAGDFNGDGFDDIAIGAQGSYNDSLGSAYVVFGRDDILDDGLDLGDLDGADGFALTDDDIGDLYRLSVAGVGDLNGDGFDDLAVGAPDGAPNDDPDRSGAGQTYVVFGSDAEPASSLDLEALDGTDGFVLNGSSTGDSAGMSVAGAGDFNGDGIADLLVSAPFASSHGTRYAGQSYVVFGNRSAFPAAFELSDLDGKNGFAMNGTSTAELTGLSVSAAGDINADGFVDLLVGAPASLGQAGATYVVLGQPRCGQPAQCGLDRAAAFSDLGFAPVWNGESLGGSFEDEYLAGDWDGNGCSDLAVRRGNLVLMSTDGDGAHDLEQRYGTGDNEDEYLVGDWNQDGCDDLAVRRGSTILMETTFDGAHDEAVDYGLGNLEDDYFVADVDGDGADDLIVRSGNQWSYDLFPWDGVTDDTVGYGGRNEDGYLVGHWSSPLVSFDAFAVRRGNDVLMNYELDPSHDFVQKFGTGANEDEYLVGDWDGDGSDNLAVRRHNRVLMDVDFDGQHDFEEQFGRGTE